MQTYFIEGGGFDIHNSNKIYMRLPPSRRIAVRSAHRADLNRQQPSYTRLSYCEEQQNIKSKILFC